MRSRLRWVLVAVATTRLHSRRPLTPPPPCGVASFRAPSSASVKPSRRTGYWPLVGCFSEDGASPSAIQEARYPVQPPLGESACDWLPLTSRRSNGAARPRPDSNRHGVAPEGCLVELI
jgi:hypothetical protein